MVRVAELGRRASHPIPAGRPTDRLTATASDLVRKVRIWFATAISIHKSDGFGSIPSILYSIFETEDVFTFQLSTVDNLCSLSEAMRPKLSTRLAIF